MRLLRIALAIAIFPGSDLQFPKVLSQRVTYQCGTIPFRSARGLIGGMQELFIENDLDYFHMLNSIHTIFHIILHNKTIFRNHHRTVLRLRHFAAVICSRSWMPKASIKNPGESQRNVGC